MKRILALTAISAAALFAAPAFADSVQVGGVTVSCTNTCVVTTVGGVTTVRDCCGGRVTVRIGKTEE